METVSITGIEYNETIYNSVSLQLNADNVTILKQNYLILEQFHYLDSFDLGLLC